ncbi:NAD-dependent epimerase/dehydratase family protein [Modicisalibacter luteus]|uniref:NAD-dependent epimerase/dehydratase family protein n=1 Tax=Modicisalibacter luteus TaxID=453962 RepID=A0ABV7M291_9GAMM|nr:NAD-dependent epimerase/dehydratase family protein [Halomonas lutea]GHB09789.1 NAD-dependent epimerase [Halomonas lutea]
MRILITGVAGFIGHALARRLAVDAHTIVGIDNLNSYYDVTLKQARLSDLAGLPNVRFHLLDLTDAEGMQRLFAESRFDCVIHMAAQAGVRHSLSHPEVYGQANLIGHLNMLEACRRHEIAHLIYASSSSVYGLNNKIPFSVKDNVDQPASLYAATKKSNELMAHSYSHLYGLPTTGLRFFTVYGPWGRPDMALFRFTRNILEGRPVELYNQGDMSRDFTYIDDVVEGITRLVSLAPERGGTSDTPYRLYNIGYGRPVSLSEFVDAIERATGKTAIRDYLPMQPGDIQHTWADTEPLFAATGFQPCTDVADGVERFVSWYRTYYHAASPPICAGSSQAGLA